MNNADTAHPLCKERSKPELSSYKRRTPWIYQPGAQKQEEWSKDEEGRREDEE
jgi:hypothetical protein